MKEHIEIELEQLEAIKMVKDFKRTLAYSEHVEFLNEQALHEATKEIVDMHMNRVLELSVNKNDASNFEYWTQVKNNLDNI